jgi:hypothetical protein
MAKARKSQSEEKPTEAAEKAPAGGTAKKQPAGRASGAAPKTAAPKTTAPATTAVAKKGGTAAKSSKPAAPTPAAPLIDTSLAAQAAAQMLAAGLNKGTSTASTAGDSPARQESAMFKQLKAGLNKPHSTTMSNLLEKSHGPEPTKSHPMLKQVGRNQTYGADLTRSGVPRRTPG